MEKVQSEYFILLLYTTPRWTIIESVFTSWRYFFHHDILASHLPTYFGSLSSFDFAMKNILPFLSTHLPFVPKLASTSSTFAIIAQGLFQTIVRGFTLFTNLAGFFARVPLGSGNRGLVMLLLVPRPYFSLVYKNSIAVVRNSRQ